MGWLLEQKALGRGIMWPLGSFQQLKSFNGWCIFPERQRPCRQPTGCNGSAAACKSRGRAGHGSDSGAAKLGAPKGNKRKQPSTGTLTFQGLHKHVCRTAKGADVDVDPLA